METTPDSQPAFVAKVLNNRATLCSSTGRPAEAEGYFKRALAVVEGAFGPDHPSLAGLLANYATVLRQMKRVTEAKKLADRAKTILSRASRANALGYTVDVRDLRAAERRP